MTSKFLNCLLWSLLAMQNQASAGKQRQMVQSTFSRAQLQVWMVFAIGKGCQSRLGSMTVNGSKMTYLMPISKGVGLLTKSRVNDS